MSEQLTVTIPAVMWKNSLQKVDAHAEEIKRLAAENSNLKALQWETLKERNKAEAENERLRKAGDEMAKHYFDLYWIMNAESTSRHEPASITDWLAAKEGRDAK